VRIALGCLVESGVRTPADVKWPGIPICREHLADCQICCEGNGAGDAANTVDLGGLKPISRPNREAGKPLPGGNPLWSVPLSVLTATQERPIFSASRRPPQRALLAPPCGSGQRTCPQKAAELERTPLALIGAVVGDSDAIAVFLDRTNQKIVRLHQGETHAGWVPSSVLRREITFKRDDRSEVLVL
jgi:general secretion pathway protein N